MSETKVGHQHIKIEFDLVLDEGVVLNFDKQKALEQHMDEFEDKASYHLRDLLEAIGDISGSIDTKTYIRQGFYDADDNLKWTY